MGYCTRWFSRLVLAGCAFGASPLFAGSLPGLYPSIPPQPDLVFRGGFEDGERLPCDIQPDADLDGLLDLACIVAFVPPDPGSVAPPADTTVVPDFGDLYDFIYKGPNPIQRGVATEAIDLRRMAVLRGRVLDEAGLPLQGVLIRVAAGSKFGYSFSRADGFYDLVVNGGGDVVIDFQKAGYVHAHRHVPNVPWRDLQKVDEVALVSLDPHLTTVYLGSDKIAQRARGSLIVDTDGARQPPRYRIHCRCKRAYTHARAIVRYERIHLCD